MKKSGGDLFIVDNTISGWTGLRYLEEWTELSTSFDIATGYFEVGALLALDGHWQKLNKIRVLMGDETTRKTKKLILEALKLNAEKTIEANLEDVKDDNPFLNGVDAIIEGIKSGQIECRVYNKTKFHAKAYITHPKLEVVGSKALVGSSNFTKPGLLQNVELNVQVQSPGEVAQLQEWYEEHWERSVDISDDILGIISRHAQVWTPFDIYSHSLRELFRDREESANVWEENDSIMFPILDQYQKEAYWSLIKIANRFGGAFLCDGVGLGKTFVGLMLLERLVVHERKNVVLLVPKSGRIPVWEENIRQFLPNMMNNPFVSLHIYNHTDLLRSANKDRDFPAEFEQIKNNADVFIIDEGHNFRNHTSNRYKQLIEVLNGDKQLFMLTATPINNSLFDLKDQIDLFTKKNEKFFSEAPLGIHNLQSYFIQKERALSVASGGEDSGISEEKAREILSNDDLFRELVVQRSRSYVKKSIEIEDSDRKVLFAEREDPQVAAYSLKKIYGGLLDKITKAAETGEGNLLALAIEAAKLRATVGEISFAIEKFAGRHVASDSIVRGAYSKESIENTNEEGKIEYENALQNV